MLVTLILTLLIALYSQVVLAQPLDVANPINYAMPQARNLQALWVVRPGFMGGTSWVDLTRRQVTTLTGMAPTGSATSGWGLTTRKGGSGEMRFDGVNDYLDGGTSTVYDFPNMTFAVAGWTRATALGTLIGRRDSAATNPSGGWFVRLNATGTLETRICDVDNGTTAGRLSVSTTLLSGAWFHWLVVFTTDTVTAGNNTITIYINGVLDQGTLTTGGGPYTAGPYPLRLGTNANGSAYLTGAMDDVRFYRSGVAASQVRGIMQGSLLQRLQPFPYAAAASVLKRARGKVY
jgi:hypothetical protein